MISFQCTGCGKPLKVQQQHAGKAVRCPGCKRISAVPNEGVAASGAGRALSEVSPIAATQDFQGPRVTGQSVDPHAVTANNRRPAPPPDSPFPFLAPPQKPGEL